MAGNFQRERGLTLVTLVLLLAIIGFFTLLILKIVPIYMNHASVVESLQAVKNTPDIQNRSKYQILDTLDRRFDINYVDHVTPHDIKILKNGTYFKLTIKYEVIEEMAGNLSVLTEFHEEIEMGEL